MNLKELCEKEALEQVLSGGGIGLLPTMSYVFDWSKKYYKGCFKNESKRKVRT